MFNYNEIENQYIVSWLGQGKRVPWAKVLGASGNSRLAGKCPDCQEHMHQVYVTNSKLEPEPYSNWVTVCIKCKKQTNFGVG